MCKNKFFENHINGLAIFNESLKSQWLLEVNYIPRKPSSLTHVQVDERRPQIV